MPSSSLFICNMNGMNEHDYEQLEKLLEKLVEKKVYKILNDIGVESTSSGKIVSLDKTKTDADGTVTTVTRASVEMPDGSVVSNLFNASGESLSVGDNVKIFGSRTNMSNRYIGIKYESEVLLP